MKSSTLLCLSVSMLASSFKAEDHASSNEHSTVIPSEVEDSREISFDGVEMRPFDFATLCSA
jgi:hypothetical protein